MNENAYYAFYRVRKYLDALEIYYDFSDNLICKDGLITIFDSDTTILASVAKVMQQDGLESNINVSVMDSYDKLRIPDHRNKYGKNVPVIITSDEFIKYLTDYVAGWQGPCFHDLISFGEKIICKKCGKEWFTKEYYDHYYKEENNGS